MVLYVVIFNRLQTFFVKISDAELVVVVIVEVLDEAATGDGELFESLDHLVELNVAAEAEHNYRALLSLHVRGCFGAASCRCRPSYIQQLICHTTTTERTSTNF